jgi:hypothetical protein
MPFFFPQHTGKLFLSLYDFDLHSGSWKYLGEDSPSAHFGLDEALGLEKTVQKKEAEEDDKSFMIIIWLLPWSWLKS